MSFVLIGYNFEEGETAMELIHKSTYESCKEEQSRLEQEHIEYEQSKRKAFEMHEKTYPNPTDYPNNLKGFEKDRDDYFIKMRELHLSFKEPQYYGWNFKIF